MAFLTSRLFCQGSLVKVHVHLYLMTDHKCSILAVYQDTLHAITVNISLYSRELCMHGPWWHRIQLPPLVLKARHIS